MDSAQDPLVVHPDWQHHPMVERCIDAHPDSPVDALRVLSEVLTDLEERFPGVPFADIYRHGSTEQPQDEQSKFARRLTANGASPENVMMLCPDAKLDDTLRMTERKLWMMSTADREGGPMALYRADGPDARSYGEYQKACALRTPLVPLQQERLELVDEIGRNGAVKSGVPGEQVDVALLKRHYHQSRGLHEFAGR